MHSKALNLLYAYAMPGGLLLAVAAALIHLPILPSSVSSFLPWTPYAVFAIGAMLSVSYNRSRVLFAMIVLCLADWLLIQYLPGRISSSPAARVVFDALAILLPLNLLAFSFMRERGTLTRIGILRFLLIGLQLIAVVVICRPEFVARAGFFLRYSFIPWHVLQQHTRFPQASLVAFALSFTVLTIRFLWMQKPLERGFFWVLITAFIALNAAFPSLYFAAAGLILVVSLIEMSHQMAYKDELTGLPGRRAFNEAALKLGEKYTLAMVDVDHFKRFNDTYGHKCGDQVLRMVAAKLSQVSGEGKAFRYGGEEFVIMFPGKSARYILIHLEQLRQAIADTEFTVRGGDRRKTQGRKKTKGPQKTCVTVSIGAADHEDGSQSFDQVIQAADKALYRAKGAGRNRVEC